MRMRLPRLSSELLARALAYVDRRGGAGLRRGARGSRAFVRSGPPPEPPSNDLVNDQGETLVNDQGEVVTRG